MTPREIILANIEHRKPARPGLTFSGDRVDDMVHAWCGPPDGYEQKRWRDGGFEYYDDPWGNIWRRMLVGPVKGEVHKPLIRDWEDLAAVRIPRYDVEALANRFRRNFQEDRNDRFRLAAIGGWIFDNARYLRSLEVYFLDMALYPEELTKLHGMVAEMYEQLIHAAGMAGADGIMIGEDMGTQNGLLFSPAMFRSYFKELYSRLMGIAHGYGMKVLLHSCGKNREILDDLADCGVDVFQFDQPALYDMEELASFMRRRTVALWSPVDIQKVLPTGDRSYIEAETRRMVRIFEGHLICKNYPDLPGIGVDPEWDGWAYDEICALANARR